MIRHDTHTHTHAKTHTHSLSPSLSLSLPHAACLNNQIDPSKPLASVWLSQTDTDLKEAMYKNTSLQDDNINCDMHKNKPTQEPNSQLPPWPRLPLAVFSSLWCSQSWTCPQQDRTGHVLKEMHSIANKRCPSFRIYSAFFDLNSKVSPFASCFPVSNK